MKRKKASAVGVALSSGIDLMVDKEENGRLLYHTSITKDGKKYDSVDGVLAEIKAELEHLADGLNDMEIKYRGAVYHEVLSWQRIT